MLKSPVHRFPLIPFTQFFCRFIWCLNVFPSIKDEALPQLVSTTVSTDDHRRLLSLSDIDAYRRLRHFDLILKRFSPSLLKLDF